MIPEHNEQWRAVAGGALPFRNWDGDFVVYNPLSGNTHILDLVSGETLTFLFEQARAAADVHQHVASFLEVPNDATLAASVDRVLEVLDELGLIEPEVHC